MHGRSNPACKESNLGLLRKTPIEPAARKEEDVDTAQDRKPPRKESLKPDPTKVRVQLDFSSRDFNEIEKLVEKLDLNTRAELFRSALVTLRWMVQKKDMGCTIVAVTPDDRLLEPEFEFLQGLSAPQGAAETVHNSLLEPVSERRGKAIDLGDKEAIV